MKHFIGILLIIMTWLGATAQQPDLLFHHLDSRAGLGDPKLWKLYKDSYGLLWIASENGLTCFDGNSCKVYRHNSKDSNSICANYITTIIEDKEKNLWIGTQNGLARYNRLQDNFTNIKKLRADRALAPNFYSFPFFIDDQNFLWAYLGGEIFKIDIASRRAQFVSTHSNGYIFVNQPFYTPLKRFVNRDVNGIFITDLTDTGAVSKGYFRGPREDRNMPATYVHQVLMLQDTLYWLCTDMGLVALNPRSSDYVLYNKTPDGFRFKARCIMQLPDRPNIYLVGTSGNGILIFDALLRKFIGSYRHDPNDAQSLSANNVSYLLADADGNVFALLPGRGLDYSNVNNAIFKRAFSKSEALKRHMSNNVTALADADDCMILATEGTGIIIMPKEENKEPTQLLPTRTITALVNISSNSIVAYDSDGLLYLLEKPTKRWIATPLVLSNHTKGNGKLVINDMRYWQQSLWLATAQGMAQLRIKGNNAELTWLHQVNDQVEWPNFQRIIPYNDKTLLLQTHYTNMYRFDCNDGALLEGKEIARTPFQTNAAVYFNKKIWLGTSSGLWIIDSSFNLFQHALPDYYCTGMQVDKNGYLWIATTNGLLRYNPRLQTSLRFTPEDGLQHLAFNTSAFLQLAQDNMVIGGINGVNIFNASQVQERTNNYDVYVTGIEINENPYLDKNSMMVQSLDLPHDNNTLALKLTPVGYGNPARLPIHYVLEGYERTLVTISGEGIIRYPQLPPGQYTFKAFGDAKGHRVALQIVIHPPFWKTWWFITSIAVLGFMVIVLLVRARIKGIKGRQQQRLRWMIQSQEEERKRIARDLHDDFGARLSTLKLYMQAAKKGQHNQQELLGHTSDMVDTAIAELRNILLNLSPKTLDENGLQAALHDMAENINRLNLISCAVDTRAFIRRLTPNAEFSLYRICQELINNTIKHAQAEHVYISMVDHLEMLVLLYEDDGKGFDRTRMPRGYGWNNIDAHVQSLGATIEVDAAPGRGIAVTIQIPKKHLP